jgi:hypothetical protein
MNCENCENRNNPIGICCDRRGNIICKKLLSVFDHKEGYNAYATRYYNGKILTWYDCRTRQPIPITIYSPAEERKPVWGKSTDASRHIPPNKTFGDIIEKAADPRYQGDGTHKAPVKSKDEKSEEDLKFDYFKNSDKREEKRGHRFFNCRGLVYKYPPLYAAGGKNHTFTQSFDSEAWAENFVRVLDKRKTRFLFKIEKGGDDFVIITERKDFLRTDHTKRLYSDYLKNIDSVSRLIMTPKQYGVCSRYWEMDLDYEFIYGNKDLQVTHEEIARDLRLNINVEKEEYYDGQKKLKEYIFKRDSVISWQEIRELIESKAEKRPRRNVIAYQFGRRPNLSLYKDIIWIDDEERESLPRINWGNVPKRPKPDMGFVYEWKPTRIETFKLANKTDFQYLDWIPTGRKIPWWDCLMRLEKNEIMGEDGRWHRLLPFHHKRNNFENDPNPYRYNDGWDVSIGYNERMWWGLDWQPEIPRDCLYRGNSGKEIFRDMPWSWGQRHRNTAKCVTYIPDPKLEQMISDGRAVLVGRHPCRRGLICPRKLYDPD